MKRGRALAAGFVLCFASSNAFAAFQLAPSQKGPFYVQGTVLGVGLVARTGFMGNVGSQSAYHLDVEFGWHFPEQKHQAFVIAVRQAFYFVDPGSAGATLARIGYDLPFDLGDDRFELTLAPYGILGGLYPLGQGDGAFLFGGGLEGKFFFWKGLYVLARPVEIGAIITGVGAAFQYNGGIGMGYAF
jgi:hypothetical protein